MRRTLEKRCLRDKWVHYVICVAGRIIDLLLNSVISSSEISNFLELTFISFGFSLFLSLNTTLNSNSVTPKSMLIRTNTRLLWTSLYFFISEFKKGVTNFRRCQNTLSQWAISELLFVSVSKWVLVLNYCKGNEFDLHKNTQLISIGMFVYQDSLWNWGMQQLGNGLLYCK